MACKEVGMNSFNYDLEVDISEDRLLKLIKELNENDEVTGILVQLPLPEHINETIVIESIDPKKDVDGFHPYTIGRLMQRIPLLRPCTAIGVITMLEEIGIDAKRIREDVRMDAKNHCFIFVRKRQKLTK